MGWALKSGESLRTRFTENQKSYLTAKLRIGEDTGSKTDPAAVARSMMCAKDPTGNVLFKSNEFLTANEIAGFFYVLPRRKPLWMTCSKAISKLLHLRPVWTRLSVRLSVS